MIEIMVENGNLERALNRFRREVFRLGILRDFQKHTFFVGKSERRKLKDLEAQKRKRKNLARMRPFDPNKKTWKAWGEGEKAALRAEIIRNEKS